MKTFFSILFVICLSLAVFAGCDTPATDEQTPGTSLPAGSSEPTGGNGTTESTGSTEATEGNGSSESTESTGSTESTEPSQGIPGPDSTQKGERITEEQYNTIIATAPTNYSYSETRTYNGKTTVITMLISGQEYLQTREEDNTTRKILGILRGDSIKDYMLNETTGKWETSNIGIVTSFPLEGFPFPLSGFTYDEARGIYTMTMEGSQLQLMFKDGHLAFLGMINGANQDMVYFYDYGTTVIPVPAAGDIVDKDNTNNSTSNSDKH